MPTTPTFEEFLALDQGVAIDPIKFVLHLVLTILCAYVLSRLYIRFGGSASNRAAFGDGFVLLAITTMLIITIVKSSLALSLGLVGALSVVRFRTAIKEPEELVFLFVCIALGLGFGAQRIVITLIGFGVTCVAIMLRFRSRRSRAGQNLFVTITQPEATESSLSELVEVLTEHSDDVHLHRFDQRDSELDASFRISIADFEALSRMRAAVTAKLPQASLSFIDQGDLP